MERIIPYKIERPPWTTRVKGFVKQLCRNRGLNTFYATLCVIDLFGVFPIVALPAAIISCGKYCNSSKQLKKKMIH